MTTRGEGRGGEGGGVRVSGTVKACPSSRGQGPESTTAREWRRLGLSPSREKPPDTDTKTRRFEDPEEKPGRTRQRNRDTEGHATVKLPRDRKRPGCRPSTAKGGANRHKNYNRRRHTTRGTGTSGRGWRSAGAVDVQVVSASHQ